MKNGKSEYDSLNETLGEGEKRRSIQLLAPTPPQMLRIRSLLSRNVRLYSGVKDAGGSFGKRESVLETEFIVFSNLTTEKT
jgi:hypothetical protein